MSDEAAFIKSTQDTLGKIIRKPPLTEKLLRKPPFRFLHDVITEVIRTTGFLDGLYNDGEMDSKNVTAREDKITFLQKAIDCTSMAYGRQLAAKPQKIVAGHEPAKTNEFLQAIAKCIKRNLSSNDAVENVLKGKKSSSSKPEGKENRAVDEKREKKRRKEKTEENHEQSKESSSDRKHRSSSGRRRREDKSDERGAGEGSDERREEKRRERKGEKVGESSKNRNVESKSSSSKAVTKTRSKTKSKDKEPTDRTREHRRRSNATKEERGERSHSGRRRHREKEEEQEKEEESTPATREEEEPSPSNERGSSRPPRPASAKGHRRRPMQEKSRETPPDGQAEEEQVEPPKAAARPPRPVSARPGAPKVRQRKNPAEEEIARIESAGRTRTAPVIVDDDGDKNSSSDEEDDQFLVQEESLQPPKMDKLSPEPGENHVAVNGEDLNEEDHGKLVRKILETKKEIETSAAKGHQTRKRTEIDRAPVNEAQHRKERELVLKSIENLRSSVQKLCRSAAPLGKMIDYIQEDMDAMNNEVVQWKRDNAELTKRLAEEESITQRTIEPLKLELEELELAIVAQMDKIATAKCNVLRNQDKVDKMIAGVTTRT